MMIRVRPRLWLAALSIVALSACASGNADVDGNWRLTWTAMNGTSGGKAYSCAAVLAFSVSQDGDKFTGSQLGTGHLVCTVDGATTDNQVAGEGIVGGVITAQVVNFSLASVLGDNTGTVTANAISGTATWSLALTSGSVSLTGTWVGARF